MPTHRHYASWRDITQAKTLYPETILTQDGQPRAVIVVPDRPAYRAQAEKIQRAIAQRCGVTVPVQYDHVADPWQPPGHNLILLGNLMDNRHVAPLYARRYIAADAYYPGRGGHVLRTVHDPWGSGHNVIFAGGSDVDGVAMAVDRLLAALIVDGKDVHLPALLDVVIGAALLADHPDLTIDPDETFIQAQMDEAHRMLETSAHGGITDPLGRAGIYYHATGKVGWAELFKRLAFLMYEDFQTGRTQYGGAWGMDADFRLHVMVPALDLAEEAPIFSDDERLQITRIFAHFIEDAIPHAADAIAHRRTRHNHWTFAALGLMLSAQYFGAYYGMAEAEDWMYVADECFIPQCHTARSHENSNGYQWLTLSHAMHYALARPYPAFFEEGHVRAICDLAIVSMDNLGYQSSYGDTRTVFGWGTEFPLLAAAAWYYDDGRYQWALQRMTYEPTLRIGARYLGGYRNNVTPVEPVDLLGAIYAPLDPTFHNSFEGDKVLPADAAYDKVVFRASFDPEDEYLLLDGLAVGGHKHYDCNALVRLTARGRIWLADGDYYCTAPNFHCGVLPLAGGRSSAMPPFTWRDHVADLRGSGFSRTTVKDYGHTDWERNILWRKGQYFLVADVMRARTAEEFDFRTLWHVVGENQVEGNRFEIRQQDRVLDITNLDGAQLGTDVDLYNTQEWKEYPHAEPVITILQQDRSAHLDAGQCDVILNLLHPRRAEDAPLAARRIDAASVLVQEASGLVWLGAHLGDAVSAPCATDAQLWSVGTDEIALVHATRFACGDAFFTAEHAVDMAFDLTSGTGEISAPLPTLLTFHGVDVAALSIDGKHRSLRRQDGGVIFSVPPGKHRFALTLRSQTVVVDRIRAALSAAWDSAASPASTTSTAQDATADAPLWQIDNADVTALIPVGDDHLLAGTADGEVWLVTGEGDVKWRRQVGGRVLALTVADYGDGVLGLVAGSTHCNATVFNLSGDEIWRFPVPFYKRDGVVRVLLAADLNHDGKDEVIMGAENWHQYVLDAEGRKLWHFESVHAATAGAVADIDADGNIELIAATEYHWWFGVGSDGQKKWQHNTVLGPGVNHVTTARQQSGQYLVAFGCRDGTVQVVDGHGQLQFVLRTADVVTGLAAADVDGDGHEEILVSSAIGNSYAVNADGSILWRVRHASKPEHLRSLFNGDGPSVLVAERSGQVQWFDGNGAVKSTLQIGGSAAALAQIHSADGAILVASTAAGLCAWKV